MNATAERHTMKKGHIAAVLLLSFLLSACAGAAVEKRSETSMQRGMKELSKGTDKYQQGCYHQALKQFYRAHDILAAADQQQGVATSMNNIGTVYRAMGDFKSARLFFEESYRIYDDIGGHGGAIQALSNQAAALIDADRLAAAEKLLGQAEKRALKYGQPLGKIWINQGVLLIKKSQYRQAEEVLNRALEGTPPVKLSEQANANFALGGLMVKTGRPEQALAYYRASLAADREAGFYRGTADNLAALGAVCLSLNLYEPAVKYLKRGVKIYALLGNIEKVAETMENLTAAAGKAEIDISVTRHFVEKWLEGEVQVSPCD